MFIFIWIFLFQNQFASPHSDSGHPWRWIFKKQVLLGKSKLLIVLVCSRNCSHICLEKIIKPSGKGKPFSYPFDNGCQGQASGCSVAHHNSLCTTGAPWFILLFSVLNCLCVSIYLVKINSLPATIFSHKLSPVCCTVQRCTLRSKNVFSVFFFLFFN